MDLLEAVRDKVMFVTEQTQWLSSSTKNRIVQQVIIDNNININNN